jgi:hypothetical protein
MITSPAQLLTTMERISRLQQIVLTIRSTTASPENYRAAAGGFLAEIDRMMLEVREYLWQPATSNNHALAA